MYSRVRHKVQIAMFPPTCQGQGRVGTLEKYFCFSFIFSLLKYTKIFLCRNTLKLIICTRNRQAIKLKTIRKLKNVSLNINVAVIVLLKPLQMLRVGWLENIFILNIFSGNKNCLVGTKSQSRLGWWKHSYFYLCLRFKCAFLLESLVF